jgi:superfamily I DNA/RNA helicase
MVFERLRQELGRSGYVTWPMVYAKLSELEASPFDAVIVDECQDLSPAQLRFLSRLTRHNAGELFFAGDLGQRIFQTPFSWSSQGVDIRGRSRTLKINYRTSHQIRRQADRLLDGTLTDADGNEEHRDGTISVFNGPAPTIHVAENEDAETDFVAQWLLERIGDGVVAKEIGIFARTDAQLARAREAIKKASDLSGKGLGGIALATMHAAKGLEFRSVCVIACDDDVIPLEDRIASIGDQADLEDVYNTERHLLYVACTRARDHLLVTGVDPVSEFLEDFTDDGRQA